MKMRDSTVLGRALNFMHVKHIIRPCGHLNLRSVLKIAEWLEDCLLSRPPREPCPNNGHELQCGLDGLFCSTKLHKLSH